MKRSKLLMGAAFAFAITAAFAFTPVANKQAFSTKYVIVGTTCTPQQRTDCDGNSTHPQCVGVFATITGTGVCQTATYKTNP